VAINDLKDLGAAVRAARLRRGLSQVAVARSAGVSREWLGRLENGAPRLEMDKVLRTLGVLDIEVLPRQERPTQADIAKAQRIAWTMSLEAQPLKDDGFVRILDKIVAHRLAQGAA
jgi:transcriptional regulator with XRE-family HTH domain